MRIPPQKYFFEKFLWYICINTINNNARIPLYLMNDPDKLEWLEKGIPRRNLIRRKTVGQKRRLYDSFISCHDTVSAASKYSRSWTGPHNPPCHLSRIVKSAPANSEGSLAGEMEAVYEEAAECTGITGRGSLNERTDWRNVWESRE